MKSADGVRKSLGIVGGGGNYPRRRFAQSSVFPRSRRLHYVSTNWEVFGVSRGLVRTGSVVASDGAITTCDHNSHAVS